MNLEFGREFFNLSLHFLGNQHHILEYQEFFFHLQQYQNEKKKIRTKKVQKKTSGE